ncbi:MAG: hypothetical protein HXY40_02545 [Chloroflexi bacterium]|nr:hypothetical protein [Chloroflexota bacterium]
MQATMPKMDVIAFDDIVTALTPHKIRILETVYNFEHRWASRMQISRALGKKRLTPYDIRALTMFVDIGIMELSTRPMSSPLTETIYIYRISDTTAALIKEWVDWRRQNGHRPMMRSREPVQFELHLADEV